jgi:hypothetical protein
MQWFGPIIPDTHYQGSGGLQHRQKVIKTPFQTIKSGVVLHIYDPAMQEAEVGGPV